MMLRPLSVHVRLLIVSMVSGTVALGTAIFLINTILARYIGDGMNEKLDSEIVLLLRTIRSDGGLRPGEVMTLPGFRLGEPGWSWSVRTPAGAWRAGATYSNVVIDEVTPKPGRIQQLGYGFTPEGLEVHVRRWLVRRNGQTWSLAATAPRDILRVPLRSAAVPLTLSVVAVCLTLLVSAMVQLKVALRPLRNLQRAVARIHSGEAGSVPEDQPAELRPLTVELNTLVARNEAGLANARAHVGNLAHSLKTPITTLSLRLRNEGASAATLSLLEQVDQRIAHHLRRARSAAIGLGTRAVADAAVAAAEIAQVVGQQAGSRAVAVDNHVAAPCPVLVEREDLEEMIGNLVENARRFASGRVHITAQPRGRDIYVMVEDDGPGIPRSEVERVLCPGIRLDESTEGYGLGLAIVRELVELYGGELTLSRSVGLGGLAATLRLPALRPAC